MYLQKHLLARLQALIFHPLHILIENVFSFLYKKKENRLLIKFMLDLYHT